MKKMLAMLMVGGLMLGCIAQTAKAEDRGVNGFLLGAGGGAILGQAIGRDTEGTLIGTAVGGMLGYVVGNELDRLSSRPVIARPAGSIIIRSGGDRHRPKVYRYEKRRRHHYRQVPSCRRDTRVLTRVNIRPRVVVIKETDWRHPHRPGGPSRGRGWGRPERRNHHRR